ncbi:MAG: YdeI/OmpD-associated family protein [Pseudomonadota bacterium]
MIENDRFDQVEVTGDDALWTWFEQNHARKEGVWLVTWKAAHRDRYVSRDQVLDALIAFGWIDGIRRKLDDSRTMQLITPRKQQAWAVTYKNRAARLIDEGRMRAPGLAAVEAGRKSGLWDAMAAVDALEEPDDLRAQLTGPAATFWSGAAPSYRRNVLRWIAGAKRPDTRARRVAEVATRAARGEKVPQY